VSSALICDMVGTGMMFDPSAPPLEEPPDTAGRRPVCGVNKRRWQSQFHLGSCEARTGLDRGSRHSGHRPERSGRAVLSADRRLCDFWHCAL